ncbi:MAG: hypothetical protein M3037_12620 [Gemmatimonadota bacterium]|nr:hypothetical protein [Gemmatimonadota bacterium]
MTLDRRRFLQITAAGIAVSLTDSACARTNEDSRSLSQPDLIEILGPEKAREIGKQYRAAVPGENTAAALRDAISSSQHQKFPWIAGRPIEVLIRDDFAGGRTVVVGGWVLSETEARQCALYSLSA